ncbi:MAG: hypothetical protein IPF52_16285 [Saprospiraceae bacterium]|nr:hypothetical protein [Saprospiraceae bacterium]
MDWEIQIFLSKHVLYQRVMWANDDDCDDNSDPDPVVTFTLTENSGILPNDGNPRNGGSVTMSETGGVSLTYGIQAQPQRP